MTNDVTITNKDDKILVTCNLAIPVEFIGKYFGFRFLFTNNEMDKNDKLKVKILKSKIIAIKDL